MRPSADVVVVGGGIFGCAVAWKLARRGAGRVLLLERGGIAQQTTSRAAALLTRVRTKPGQTALVTETRRAIADLEAELDDALDLRAVGSLHLAASAASERDLLTLVAAAEACDEPVSWIGREEAEERAPWLSAAGARRIAFMPRDAFLDPYRLATAYAAAAGRRGVELVTGVEVTGLVREGARVAGVETAGGEVRAAWVVDCAGPWAGLLAREAGRHLPMAPVRSHYWITEPGPAYPTTYPAGSPVVVLPDAGAYARPEVGGLLFGLRDRRSLARDPRSLPRDLSELVFEQDPGGWDVLVESGPSLARFFPGLDDAGIAHYVAGPSTYTPDGQFVIGALPGVEGFLVASGCCGAGIATSGGVGRAIAELVVDGASSLDLEPFRPERYGNVDAFSPGWLARCAQARSEKTSG